MTEPLAGAAAAPYDTLPFAVLVDEAWKSTRRNVRSILVPVMLLVAPAALLIQIFSAMVNLQVVGLDPASFGGPQFFATVGLGCAGALVVGLYMMVIQGAMMVAVTRTLGGEPPAIKESVRLYLHPRMWGTDLMAWILITFITLVGLVLCIVPGVVAMCVLPSAWALRRPVMVREGLYGWNALRRSWDLLDHNPGQQWIRHPLVKVVVLFVLGIVLIYAVSMVFQLPAMVVNQVIMFREISKGQTADPQAAVRATLWLAIPGGILASLGQLAVQLYMDFAFAHLYYDQRRRKEGADLATALDQLTGPGPGPGTGLLPAGGAGGPLGPGSFGPGPVWPGPPGSDSPGSGSPGSGSPGGTQP